MKHRQITKNLPINFRQKDYPKPLEQAEEEEDR